VLGTALAFADGRFALLPALAALVCAVLMQITSNLVNDLYDFRKGADTTERLGPPRAIAAGLLTEQAVKRAAWYTASAAFVIGQYLVWVSGWQILAIGIASLVVAWAYTGGPKPLAYLGLGELCAFVFFGVVPVCGTYFVQTHVWSVQALTLSVIPGIFAANILMTNNIRDIATDRIANKYTLPVRLGEHHSRTLYTLLTVLALVLPMGLWLMGWTRWMLAGMAAVPLAVNTCRQLYTAQGAALNIVLLYTVRLLIVTSALLSAALCYGRLAASS
jgi:1,4-dihydroxy-2-naphthoate octaprenyltransferase